MKTQINKVLLIAAVALCASTLIGAHVAHHDHYVLRSYGYNINGVTVTVKLNEHGNMTLLQDGRPKGTTNIFCQREPEAVQ